MDTHCHLHFPGYDIDRKEVYARMVARRIWGVTIGTSLANSEAGIALAATYDGIWATVGLHPDHVTSDHHDENEGDVQEKDVDEDRLRALAQSSDKVVAIGETGLDFYHLNGHADESVARASQERVFLTHLRVAHALDLPMVIHCREALTRLAELLQLERSAGRAVRAVVHSFTGTWEEAKPLLDLGCLIAVNGIATFPLKKNADPILAIDRTIERIPGDRLLIETDAPYLAPSPYRGKRNEPAYVEEVAKHVAAVRGMTLEEVAAQTTQNARELFGI